MMEGASIQPSPEKQMELSKNDNFADQIQQNAQFNMVPQAQMQQ